MPAIALVKKLPLQRAAHDRGPRTLLYNRPSVDLADELGR
jgi:hypothetical protein